ncbi:glycosyltransferase family 2 protein [Cryptosporangium sp. NPDC051539]|uniref:glycosyltransferase family 2 protein n=1 Tax=Cryptosporangium sp. NPDC051539 TaxID=3363962 RepID=UPI0037A41764
MSIPPVTRIGWQPYPDDHAAEPPPVWNASDATAARAAWDGADNTMLFDLGWDDAGYGPYDAPAPVSSPVGVGFVTNGTASLEAVIGHLSGGKVLSAPASGPAMRTRRVRRHALLPDTFTPALGPGRRFLVHALTAGWLATLVFFWFWWLQPEHRHGWAGLLINSALLAYLSIYPILPILRFNKITTVNPHLPVPGLRIAFCVTKAPSEPWDTARTTLEAMLRQHFPHPYDVWICDEDPSEETLRWCRQYGVHVSTRRGQPEYQRDTWPRRKKCKEGNLAYFYDHYGYRDYDVVAQLDCDHIPSYTYLAEMVRPFADDSIGYVAAPSVCDTNADVSWSARGRLYREAAFHGPYQAGCNAGYAPSCIGSHYAVRTRALRDIGGVGPELAEDFTTTYLLSSAGWQGAFALAAEAHGEGPPTFAAMLTQEFQWSRSLTTVLLSMTRHLRRMPWSLRLRFLHALFYYPLLTFTTAAGLCLAPVAVITGVQWVDVPYLEFIVRFGAVNFWLLGVVLVLRGGGVRRPNRAPIISWEDWLYMLTRWPLNLRGVLAAAVQKVRPRPINFRVTPKGSDGFEKLPTGLLTPYFVISLAMSGTALVGELVLHTSSGGYLLLCLFAANAYLLVGLTVPWMHAREAARNARVGFFAAFGKTVRLPFFLATLVIVPFVAAVANYPFAYLRALYQVDDVVRLLHLLPF